MTVPILSTGMLTVIIALRDFLARCGERLVHDVEDVNAAGTGLLQRLTHYL